MTHALLAANAADATPIHIVPASGWDAFRANLPPVAAAFAAAQDFEAKPGRHILLPDEEGRIAAVVLGAEKEGQGGDPFHAARLVSQLPAGDYRFAALPSAPELAVLGWLIAGYRFDRYRKLPAPKARLVPPEGVDTAEVARIADAVSNGRDLINTPANDLGPDEIEAAIRDLAARHGAAVAVTAGDDILAQNFPMIHAVGRASTRAPRLVDLTWGETEAPKVTLVGKGVAFDTGGLDIKPSAAMLLMKKDMGGAAAAIACADMVMGAGLPVRLRLLVPAVENAISGSSFRPGDVLPSRKGISVEIGNTDAEGRLILADALALADEEEPALIADFATLTGAARVALGPDLPPFYTREERLAADLARLGTEVNDPVWRMPLWPPYEAMLDSKIADVNHVSGGAFAGSVTAALFLARFVEKAAAHVHFDIFGWTPKERPGRPEGGEVQAARLVYALVKERYAVRG